MEFLVSNWLYFAIAALMAYMMFKKGGCCGGHSDDSHSHSKNSNSGGCCSGQQDSNFRRNKE